MLFVEFRFLCFFPRGFFASIGRCAENRVAQESGYWSAVTFFYAAWNWKFLLPAHGIEPARLRRGHDAGADKKSTAHGGAGSSSALTANLGTIAFFKYYNFFVTSAAALLAWLGLPASIHTLDIIIPVGGEFLHVPTR